jgi:hypothetical protein
MIRPEVSEDEDGMEQLEDGFYHSDDHEKPVTDFDVRTILPASLQKLYLHGTFDGEQSDF